MLTWENLLSEFPLVETPFAVTAKRNEIHYRTSIVEFTFNYPRGIKKFADKTAEEQRNIYLDLIGRLEKTMTDCLGDLVYYFESCQDGTQHMHGRFRVKEGLWYVEGIIQTFVKNALGFIDGRLKYARGNYYYHLQRYRSPCICVQFTDDFERTKYWEQYIRKNIF